VTAPLHVVRVGAPTTVTPVRVGQSPSPTSGGTVTGTTRPTLLDELGDVEGATAAPIGATLTKGGDGKFHGRLPEAVDWWSGDGPPPLVIPGASPGDFYFDQVGKGLYRLN
jgi:hypothetical protein